MITLFARPLAAGALLIAGLTPAAARDASVGPLTVRSPWTRPTPPGAPAAAGYMRVTNRGRVGDRLLGASSPSVTRVEVHEMTLEGGIMRMRHLPRGLEVPAGGSAELKPGGYHLMLIGPRRPFAVGASVPVTLRFERAGAIRVELDVRQTPPDASGKEGAR